MNFLLIEDDPRSAKALQSNLVLHGHTVVWAQDGFEGLALASAGSFDCLMVDVMLPGADGFTLVSDLRLQGNQIPVVFLTARDGVEDRLRGLQIGGGDYLVKPFSFAELMLRIQNLLRRGSKDDHESLRTAADLTLDPVTRRVTRGGRKLELTTQEFAILDLLLRHQGAVVTRARLAEEVWGGVEFAEQNLLDAAIRRVRLKVDEGFTPPLIHTRRGIGYVLEAAGAQP